MAVQFIISTNQDPGQNKFSAVLAQRNKNRPNRNKNKNRPKATQAPKLIPDPAQEEPGLADNRQEIANMLAFKV